MSDKNIVNDEMFECKMYITDLENNKNSKEINVQDLVFNDWIEFEFGNFEDDDYGTLPYKDFKFFINDYSVTFYSPQYQKALQQITQLTNNWNELKEYMVNLYIVGHTIQNATLDSIFHKIKELEEKYDER